MSKLLVAIVIAFVLAIVIGFAGSDAVEASKVWCRTC